LQTFIQPWSPTYKFARKLILKKTRKETKKMKENTPPPLKERKEIKKRSRYAPQEKKIKKRRSK
jgi:hypothetical protein